MTIFREHQHIKVIITTTSWLIQVSCLIYHEQRDFKNLINMSHQKGLNAMVCERVESSAS